MKTLAIFCPENAHHPCKTFDDIIISDKKLRIIYYKENMPKLQLLLFKMSVKKLLKDADILLTDFSKNFSGNKLYKSGHSLAMYHIKAITNIAAKKLPVTVFSCNIADIYALSDLIMSHKKIRFLTNDAHISEFEDTLSGEFGLSGGAACNISLSGEVAVIMPGGEIFSPEGAEKIINLSKTNLAWNAVNPENILYAFPPSFRGVPNFLRHGDMLETVFSFLEMDFSRTSPNSLKFNKHTSIKN